MPHEEIAWWNFNVPLNQQTQTCPDSLLKLGEKDKRLIGTWDADYERLTWDEVKELIGMWFNLHSPLHHHPKLVTLVTGILLYQIPIQVKASFVRTPLTTSSQTTKKSISNEDDGKDVTIRSHLGSISSSTILDHDQTISEADTQFQPQTA